VPQDAVNSVHVACLSAGGASVEVGGARGGPRVGVGRTARPLVRRTGRSPRRGPVRGRSRG
jgi:hypothetical protein